MYRFQKLALIVFALVIAFTAAFFFYQLYTVVFFLCATAMVLAGIFFGWSENFKNAETTLGLAHHAPNGLIHPLVEGELPHTSAHPAMAENLVYSVARQFSKEDQTGKDGLIFQGLKEKIQHMREDGKNRSWITQGLASLNTIKKSEDRAEFAGHVIDFLVQYLGAGQGVFYVINDGSEEACLEQIAARGYKDTFSKRSMPLGEGMPGQCAVEKEIIFLTRLPEGSDAMAAETKVATAQCLLVVPMLVSDRVYGVLEFTSRRAMEPYHLGFIKKAAESIAHRLFSYVNHRPSRKLETLPSTPLQEEPQPAKAEVIQTVSDDLSNMQEALQHTQVELDGLQYSINQWIGRAEFSPSGDVITVNPVLENLLHKSKCKVKSLRLEDLIDIQLVDSLLESVLSGEFVEQELYIELQDAATIWLRAGFSPVYNPHGEVTKILLLTQDITDVKEKTKDVQQRWNVVSKTNAVIELDAVGKITYVNALFLQTTGFEAEELIGKDHAILMPHTERGRSQAWQQVLTGKSFTGEFSYIDKDGLQQWILGSYNPVIETNGSLSKIVMVGQFITDEKEKREELDQYVQAFKQSLPLFEINSHLQLKSCNEKFLGILGLNRVEFAHKQVEDLLSPESFLLLKEIMQNRQNETAYTATFAFIKKGRRSASLFATNIMLLRDRSDKFYKAVLILCAQEAAAVRRL